MLPHPRAHERAFVLVPLAAVDSEAVLPGPNGGAVSDLLGNVDVDSVEVVVTPWPSGPEPAAEDSGAIPIVDPSESS